MKLLKSYLIVLSSLGLMFLGACSSSNQAANPDSTTSEKPAQSGSPQSSVNQAANPDSNTGAKPDQSASSQSIAAKTKSAGHAEGSRKGGQVVESGKYHLEFVPEKEEKGFHLDFYLLSGDNHDAVPNAKVTGLVQMPDGTQKPLNFTYEPERKHYTALLPEKATGQYQLKISSDINGENVSGRFTFNQ